MIGTYITSKIPILLFLIIIHLLFIKKKNEKLSINNNFFERINDYITLCQNEHLINGIQKSSEKIKISVVIPVFNSSKSIKPTIRSIQNINMPDIEIILVDDYSLDNTVHIIQELQKEDVRIKLIKNEKNKGTLFSRSIGALSSKGEYIMSIDQDDFFINNILKKSYKEAKKNNIDILEFSGFEINNTLIIDIFPQIPYYLLSKENNKIIKQPELSNFIYKKEGTNYTLIDAYIWGKIIKSTIYNKALNLIGENIYSLNVCWSEDRLLNFALFRVAFTFKFINYYGIIHYLHNNSVGALWKEQKKKDKISHDEIINIINIYFLTKNSEDVNIAAYELEHKVYLIFSGINYINKKYIKWLLNNILNCKYLYEYKRHNLIILYNKLFNNSF